MKINIVVILLLSTISLSAQQLKKKATPSVKSPISKKIGNLSLDGKVDSVLKLMTLDFATYGEEISTNMGGLEDRRFAFRLAFQI